MSFLHIHKGIVAGILAVIPFFFPFCNANAAYPDRPVTFIVPFPAGGGVDIVSRILAERIHVQTGKNVVVENREGAGGTIGVGAAARSSPDGYTVTLGSPGNISIAPTAYKKLSYDPAKDIEPVAMAVQMPILVVAKPGAPFKNIQELIKYAKTNPGELTYGSGGVGTSLHLAGALLAEEAGIDVVHIPYKGSSQAIVDLLGGRIDYMFIDTSAMATITSGKAQLLAVTSAQRSSLLPDIPTVAESGVTGYETSNWYGFFVPHGTGGDQVEWLSEQIGLALQDQEVKSKLKHQMLTPAKPQTPKEISHFINQDIAKWKALASTLDLSK